MKNKIINIILISILGALVLGCTEDLMDMEPTSVITPEQIATSSSALESTVNGFYSAMYAYPSDIGRHNLFGQKGVGLSLDFFTGDVTSVGGNEWFSHMMIGLHWLETYYLNSYFWEYYYGIIKEANGMLDGFPEVPSDPDIQSYYAQALTLRAHSYFYLINLFQEPYAIDKTAPGVPIYTSLSQSDGSRSTVDSVYNQIIADLELANSVFETATPGSNTEINADVAKGLLAQVLMFTGDYENAAKLANEARANYTLMSESDYESGFNSVNNPEWMWGTVVTDLSVTDWANWTSHMNNDGPGYAGYGAYKQMDTLLYALIDDNDYRKKRFNLLQDSTINAITNPIIADKFTSVSPEKQYGDLLYMRASEMYLIEAEALARDNKEDLAKPVLDELIKERCGGTNPYNTDALSGDDFLEAIRTQARIELWGEGKVAFYAKRYQSTLQRGSNSYVSFGGETYAFNDPMFLMQIPKDEIDNNPNISNEDQNP